MRVHRDLGWLAEATGRPGKGERGTPPKKFKNREKKTKTPKKQLRGRLALPTWAGGTGTGAEAGRGGPAPPHPPAVPPLTSQRGGEETGAGGTRGSTGGRVPGPGRIRAGAAALRR